MNTYQKQKSNYSIRRALIQQLVNVKVAENDQQRAEAHKLVKSLKMQLKMIYTKKSLKKGSFISLSKNQKKHQ